MVSEPALDPEDVKAEAFAATSGHMDNCESIQHELAFQKAKQYKNQAQAFLDGHLLASEIDPELQEVAEIWAEHQHRLDAERERAASRSHRLLAPATPQLLDSLIFLENESAETHCRCLAGQVFCGEGPGATWAACHRCATLQGGCVCDLRFMKNLCVKKKGGGVAFLYDAAISISRKVFVCPQFEAGHPVLAQLVERATSLPYSKWKLLDSWDSFAQVHGRCAAKNALGVIALTMPSVCTALNSRNILTKASFIERFRVMSCVSRNACGV